MGLHCVAQDNLFWVTTDRQYARMRAIVNICEICHVLTLHR